MYIVEFFAQIASFNFGWIIAFVQEHLFWLFAFALVTHVIFGEKNFVRNFLVFVVAMWLWDAWGYLSGVALFGAKTLTIYYITKIGLLAFVENSERWKDRFVVISSIQGVAAIFIAQLI
ncbi:MAG: hypothetical protein NUV67_03075 [archaeon]|nr:hypothetical protein [archaeon]